MPTVSFRFLHAADFRLDQPVTGLVEVPKALRQALIDAPYRAAARVFAAAMSEDVEFVILAGDMLDMRRSGPRGPLFLIEQFEKLAERGIQVYWATGGTAASEHWPTAFPLPDNVTIFPADRVQEQVHERADGQSLAFLAGRSRAAAGDLPVELFRPDPEGLFTIAVSSGRYDAAALAARGIPYWALGGRRRRRNLSPPGTTESPPCVVHWPGTPQGRHPSDTGCFSCSLVQVEGGAARVSTIPTSVLQWHVERIIAEDATSAEDLQMQALERIEAISQSLAGADLLVTWEVGGNGPLLRELARGELDGNSLQREFLRELCDEGSRRKPAVWSVAVKVDAPDVLPGDYYKQQTVLGDFLRRISHYQMNPDQTLDISNLVSSSFLEGPLMKAADLSDPTARQRILREAALLGVDLLSGEDTHS